METDAPPSVGTFIRRYRRAAGLTQEELAERAQVSAPTISALERGVSQLPHPDTIERLAEALRLSSEERAALQAARRRYLAQSADAQPAEERGPARPRTNVPLAMTSFIGRASERATVLELLRQTRLLTLTGAGGCGKTRLALHVAGALLEEYPDGVWLVELASLTSPALVPQAVATVLGAPEQIGRPVLDTLTDLLAPKQLLLVLDNCEHLVDACADLASTLARGCGQLRMLATSREGLAVDGETTYVVPSLEVPNPWQVLPLEELLGFAAVRLFVERARARRTDFALTARNAAAVVRICHHLDGIPLAIELAAARIDTMPVEGIAARLDDCFRLLTGGPRTALPRQKTLRATLDWSYDLLSARERIVLPRLSVFAGGWTLEAAEAVCVGEGVESKDVLDLLAGMVHKSLVLLEERGDRRAGSARYRLLDTVRQYARELLLAGGTDTVVRRRFRAWCLAFAERADAMIEGLEQETWLDRIDTELDNLRAVMARSLTDAEVTEAGMRLATALRWFWALRLRIDEGRWWLEATLAAGGAVSAAARAAALYAAGRLADLHGDRERAHALYTQCFPLFQQLGDNNRLAYTLHWLSWHAHRLGDHERAAALREESLRLFRESGDKQGFAQTLIMLGSDAQQQGDFVQAATYWEEALTLLRELGVTWNLSVLLMELAGVARVRGDYAGAEAYLAEGLTLYQELGFMDGIVAAHSYLGEVAAVQGELDQAAAWFQRGLALCGDDERQKVHLPQYRYGLGIVARLRGDYRQAIALFEESLTEIREAGVPGPLARVLTDLGHAVHDQGDAARAQALYRESLALLGSKGYKPHIARNLEGLAAVSARYGQPERAARQFGVAAALRDLMGAPLPPSERSAIERSLAEVRAALGVDTFEAAWTAGRTLGLDEAVAEALRIGTAIV